MLYENNNIIDITPIHSSGGGGGGDGVTREEMVEYVSDTTYTKQETNDLLEDKADKSELQSVEGRVDSLEQGDVFVPTTEYEEKCADYDSQLLDLQTNVAFLTKIVTTPHYDILPESTSSGN